ncbi:folliculin [Bombus fervidus]|uniref:folliculin n=1 Tax=Bombus fervidus TaxID=203811 RepID=UPI003AB45327
MCELKEQEYDYFDTIMNKSLMGMAKIHNNLITLEECNAILRKDYANMIGKVKLISGGRAENELIYPGVVGPGMLTAAVLGNTFSAPSVDNILRVIEEVGFDHTEGILLIVQNYAEYSINFNLAKLYAELKGYVVRLITINNSDMFYFGNSVKEHNLLPTLFICKIAGAMSEEGKCLDEIYSFCNSIANSGEIILLKTDDYFEDIVHEGYKLEMFPNLVKQVLKPLIDILNITSQNQTKTNIHETKKFCIGHEVAIIISNFGCSQIQGNIFILELLQQIEINGLKLKRIYMKEFMKYSNSNGFHICLLNLSFNTVLIKYLDFPTLVSTWPVALGLEEIETKKHDETKLITLKKNHKNMDWNVLNFQGPTMNHKTSQTFLLIISMASEAIIACERQLNIMDQKYGNRDYGTSLACGAKAIQNAIQKNEILGTNLYITFLQISHIIQKTVSDIRGRLYFLFFFYIAEAFSKYENDKEITVDVWLHVLITANKAIEQFKASSVGVQILLTTLTAVQIDLQNALSRNVNPIDAFGIAVRAAENFTTNVLYTQSSHELKYPDPQAHSVGVWMRAAYEGTNVMEDGQHECEGCQSIGNVKYLSNEHETRTSFLSAQQSLTQDIWCLLKHACFRSLSCEVHPGKEGVCYFGDEYRGHVLSHTFTLKDAQARGFRKWCSFIVFMRDKQFLLNMWPFLVDNLKEVIRELQDFAEKKYNAEEAECPQRVVRLSTANNGPGLYNNSNRQPRTFSDITNEKHVFIRIHMWLVWILSAGARHFIEIFPMSLLDDELNYNLEDQIETEDGFTLVNAKLPVNLTLNSNEPETTLEFSEVSGKSTTVILKDLRAVLGKDQFRQLLYSSLTGVQILVRGPNIERLESLYGLSSLIPRACRRVKTQATEYMDPNKCNFIGVDTSVAVPLPCANVCRLDIVTDEHKVENSSSHIVRWTGTLPLKLPTLLTKIEKSLENEKLGNSTLKAHFAALQEEWANIAKVVHAMRGRGHSGDLSGLMLSLGAGPHDKKLLDTWSMGLPPNPA